MRIHILRFLLGTLATAVVLVVFLYGLGRTPADSPDAIPSCVPAPWCRV